MFASEEMLDFYREIDILSKLRHPEIVEMYGVCKQEGRVCLVTEYVKGGNLESLINEREVSPIDSINLLLSIVRGMIFLHSRGIIHRDLKLGNLFLDGNINVKVWDFGLAALIENPGGRRQYGERRIILRPRSWKRVRKVMTIWLIYGAWAS